MYIGDSLSTWLQLLGAITEHIEVGAIPEAMDRI